MIDLEKTLPGHLVRCIPSSPGVAREVFERNLDRGAIVDEVYMVSRLEVSSSYSSVYLLGMKESFNPLGFDNI